MTVTLKLDDELSKATLQMAEERHATVDQVILAIVQREAANRQKSLPADEAASERVKRWDETMTKLAHFETGGPYTHEEMNER